MKKVFSFALLLALASTTAFAGTAVFNGIPAPFGNDAAPVFHPNLVDVVATAGVDDPAVFGVTLSEDGVGWDVVNWVTSTTWNFALSETGVASNDAIYTIIDTEDYEIVYNFTLEDGAFGPDPFANSLRLDVALTFSDNFGDDIYANHNNLNYVVGTAAKHEGDKFGLEWQGKTDGLSFRAWQADGTGALLAVAAPGLTWGGVSTNLASDNAGRVLPVDLIGKMWTVRIARDAATGDTNWYLKIEGLADFLTEKLVLTLPGTFVDAPLYGGGYGDMGTMDDRNELTASILATGFVADPTGVVKSKDVPHFRFRGHLGNFTAVVSGDAVTNMNASLLGAEGVPSIQAPFFAE